MGRPLTDANLTWLKKSYDIIVFLYSNYKADGSMVLHSPCCYWGIGQEVDIASGLVRNSNPELPNYYLLHESLHDYESYNDWQLRQYNGIGGVHGAGQHGFAYNANAEPDFVYFYRLLMRGQVAELRQMRDQPWTGGVPATGDLYVGVFTPMRRGVHWP